MAAEKTTVVTEQGDIDKYDTGATRGAVRERYDLLPLAGLRRAALGMARGAENHGERNWMRGMPTSHCINHAIKHLVLYMQGDESEDHLGHAICNLMMAAHFDEEKKGE